MRAKLFAIIFGIVVAAACMVATAQAAGNLISNNSLEAGTTTAATSWVSSSWGSLKAAFSIKSGGAQTGTRSAYVQVSNYVNGDARWQPSTPVAVAGGEKYDYSSWYKANVRTEVDAEIIMQDGTTVYWWLGDVAASSTTWKQVKYTITLPVGAKQLTIYHLIARNGWLQTDEYSLVKQGETSTSPTSPSPTTPPPTTTTQPSPTSPAPSPTSPAPSPTTPPPSPTTPPPSPTTPPPAPSGPFSRPLASIEFDDGWTSAYQYGLPTVESFGWRPTQYIITDTVVNNANYGAGTYMTAAQVKDWKARGDIGSHTVDHKSLISLSSSQVSAELTTSKTYLDTLLGTPTRLFATPYCDYNATVTMIVQTLYQHQRNCDGYVNTKGNFNRYNVSSFMILSTTTDAEIQAQLNAAKTSNGWVVFVWHQVAGNTGDAYSVSQATLTRQLQLIKNSGIAVVTSQQALNESLGL